MRTIVALHCTGYVAGNEPDDNVESYADYDDNVDKCYVYKYYSLHLCIANLRFGQIRSLGWSGRAAIKLRLWSS